MVALPIDEKVSMVTPFLDNAGLLASFPAEKLTSVLPRVLESLGDRIKVAGDILDYRDRPGEPTQNTFWANLALDISLQFDF